MSSVISSELITSFFRGLGKLKSLNLTGCKLKKIEPESFIYLMNLIDLDLSKNEFETLKSGSFLGLSNLKHLKLSECTQLRV
jgi:hypothetical protein